MNCNFNGPHDTLDCEDGTVDDGTEDDGTVEDGTVLEGPRLLGNAEDDEMAGLETDGLTLLGCAEEDGRTEDDGA